MTRQRLRISIILKGVALTVYDGTRVGSFTYDTERQARGVMIRLSNSHNLVPAWLDSVAIATKELPLPDPEI